MSSVTEPLSCCCVSKAEQLQITTSLTFHYMYLNLKCWCDVDVVLLNGFLHIPMSARFTPFSEYGDVSHNWQPKTISRYCIFKGKIRIISWFLSYYDTGYACFNWKHAYPDFWNFQGRFARSGYHLGLLFCLVQYDNVMQCKIIILVGMMTCTTLWWGNNMGLWQLNVRNIEIIVACSC